MVYFMRFLVQLIPSVMAGYLMNDWRWGSVVYFSLQSINNSIKLYNKK